MHRKRWQRFYTILPFYNKGNLGPLIHILISKKRAFVRVELCKSESVWLFWVTSACQSWRVTFPNAGCYLGQDEAVSQGRLFSTTVKRPQGLWNWGSRQACMAAGGGEREPRSLATKPYHRKAPPYHVLDPLPSLPRRDWTPLKGNQNQAPSLPTRSSNLASGGSVGIASWRDP